jgi:4'-phosphopantetheinyl transferase
MTPVPVVHIDPLDNQWLNAADACLSPEETARAQRFHHPSDRDTWRAGRAWVRHHLAARLQRAPDAVAFEHDNHGRPRILDVPPDFDANWSHSGRWMALVLSSHGPAGIDIEVLRPGLAVDELAATVCSPEERLALAGTSDPHSRSRLFLRFWTAKEALMKATGLGAALEPGLIAVHLQPDSTLAYSSHPNWQIASRESDEWIATWTWKQ